MFSNHFIHSIATEPWLTWQLNEISGWNRAMCIVFGTAQQMGKIPFEIVSRLFLSGSPWNIRGSIGFSFHEFKLQWLESAKQVVTWNNPEENSTHLIFPQVLRKTEIYRSVFYHKTVGKKANSKYSILHLLPSNRYKINCGTK